MYKLNLYPEYELKRARRRRSTVLTGVLTAVACLQVGLLASQALNAGTAGRQADLVFRDLPRLEQMIEAEKQPSPEIQVARELIELRRGRVDWTPALAAISRAADRSLTLTKLVGDAGREPGETELTITGETRTVEGQLETIGVLMDRLRGDEGFRSVLASVSLGKVESGRAGEFEVECRAAEVTQ